MRPRPPRRPRALRLGVAGFIIALGLATASEGQAPPADPNSPARCVPRDGLRLYIEYQGLDAQAEAWRKTAAYKILNNTTAGAMLEDVAAQLLDKLRAMLPNPKEVRSGPELVALVKHMARSGFVLALGDRPDRAGNGQFVWVFRGGYKDKEIRAILARNLGELNAPGTRPQAVVRAGHKVIGGVMASGQSFAWWVEESKKEDIILVSPGEGTPEAVLEALDGKRPSMLDDPRRLELASGDGGFVPNGWAFLGPKPFEGGSLGARLGLDNLSAMEIRWGFQGDALMTSTRIATTGPRKGILGLFDGSTFDKAKLPPIPESVAGFTVLSFDLKPTLEKLVATAKVFVPDAEDRVNRALDAIKARTKVDFKEKVLAHLGPKVAWYILPGRPSTAASSPAAAPGILGTIMAGAGLDQVPRLALVFDVDDPTSFGKVLDEGMVAVNRELKAQAAAKAGGAAGGEAAAAAKGARGRGPSVPSAEFRLMPGESKMYVLSVPPELAGQFPGSFRPAIRLGPKQVVVAASADVARAALESKGSWTPPNDLGPAFLGLSSRLKVLRVSDPRETLPGLLAAFPAKLQASINTALLMRPKPPGAEAAAPIPPAAPPAAPTNSGMRRPLGGDLGSTGPGPSPGGPGSPGAPGAPPTPGGPGTVVLQVDPAKLPSAESIKALLFPSVLTVEATADEIKVVSRSAFPALGDPSRSAAAMGFLPGLMGRASLAAPPVGVAPGAAATPAPTPAPAPNPNGPPPAGGTYGRPGATRPGAPPGPN